MRRLAIDGLGRVFLSFPAFSCCTGSQKTIVLRKGANVSLAPLSTVLWVDCCGKAVIADGVLQRQRLGEPATSPHRKTSESLLQSFNLADNAA